MSTPRAPVLLALFVILLTAGYCKKSARRIVPGTSAVPDGRSLIELIMDKVRLARDSHADGRTEYPVKKLNFSFEAKENNDVNKSHHIIEVFPRDLARKEKIIKHFTGPLYFNPKCRKHFYRLYHNTRDCTIPDYYKRCARLLIRLAGSQRCSER